MGWFAEFMALTSNFHAQISIRGADGGTHACPMHLFIILTLEEEVCFFDTKV